MCRLVFAQIWQATTVIVDASNIANGTKLPADLCIIGAGVAGIAVALEFEHSQISVLLLEAGGVKEAAATQAFYDGDVIDRSLHPPLTRYRRRALGGSSGIWGGRCVPFDPIDFEARPWVPRSGWPLRYEDLLPYYKRASWLCEAGDFAYSADEAFPDGMPAILSRFRGRHFTDTTLERFSCPTNFGMRYRKRLLAARNITVLLRASAVELDEGRDGQSVAEVSVATLGGLRFSVQPRYVVLAAGGLEVPRLLLASRRQRPAGIGNAHDQVGRCYMSHIAGTIGKVSLPAAFGRPCHGYRTSDDGTYCRRRFALTADAQQRLGVGNFIARLHHPAPRDPSHRTGVLSALFFARPAIRFEYALRLHGHGKLSARDWLRHLCNVAFDLPDTCRFAWHWLRDHSLAERKFPSVIVRPKGGQYSVDFHAEQAPNLQSRVKLGTKRDALGMPKLVVDWRVTPLDMRTVREALAALKADFSQTGCATLEYDPDEVEACALRYGAYGGHHIGTARMSASPQDGVVDAQCRVHGMENLFIAGSAVFPTSSQANPTLTIAALALRLADGLKRDLSVKLGCC